MENMSKTPENLEMVKLQRENRAAYKTIDKLIVENKKKDQEISDLKRLLESSVPVLVPQRLVKFEIPPEEEIAEVQLNKLREISRQRPFTVEEGRLYDILVKNKRLAQEKSTINVESKDYTNVKEADLIAIAGRSTDDDDSSDNS